MKSKLEKLIELATAQIGRNPTTPERLAPAFGQEHGETLVRLLGLKNGFYAFEGALHVLSDFGNEQEHGLIEWNSAELWKNRYRDMATRCLFFAEDAFGNQFCINDGRIFTFDPETGGLELFADDMDAWARRILDDYNLWTGHQLARDWQKAHGAIPIGSRLVPAIPFILGGEYAVANLHPMKSAGGMRWRASIAMQIRDLPDGASVKLTIVE